MVNVCKCRAFTLIELLVVISIIAVLIAILLPALTKARDYVDDVQCLSNLRSFNVALASYLNENQGYMPGNYTAGGDDVTWHTWLGGDPDPSGSYSGSLPSEDRPLNRYLTGPRDAALCPRDSGFAWYGVGNSASALLEVLPTAHEVRGSSYVASDRDPSAIVNDEALIASGIWMPAGHRETAFKSPSRKVWIYDEPAYLSRQARDPINQWHGASTNDTIDYANLRVNYAYLDGHAKQNWRGTFLFWESLALPGAGIGNGLRKENATAEDIEFLRTNNPDFY